MKRLFLDCQMGIAGDMLTATLLGLVDNPEMWIAELNQMGISDVTYTLLPKEEKGLQGYRVAVTINGIEESEHYKGSSHDQHHTDHHHAHHEHGETDTHEDHSDHHIHSEYHVHGRGLQGVMDIINSLSISDTCKQNAINVYQLVAEAEAKVHKSTVTQIHFHELGMLDAIADIVAVCVLLEALKFDEIIISPIHVGTGTVHCAHGELPVPAPATMELLAGIPMYADYQIKGELCTPTGAALAKYFGTAFSHMPVLTPTKVSYGFGTKQFERPNCIRAFVDIVNDSEDTIIEMACNLDDMTPEEIGYAVEQLLLSPALDVFTTPIMMKKQRPSTMLTVLCKIDDIDSVRDLIFKHTTSIGIRYHRCDRYILNRSAGDIDWEGNRIAFKTSSGFGVERHKYEYDSLAAIAKQNDMSLLDLKRQLRKKED
ncbi:MAG: nickel pincer cofactor biosynthesis protein LarC [Veillonella sp.]|uniref:nickel pincer cofactor biosynthesis protein LarC n=1 Tax=Veillonella sp. TaxID=1926307 RepID=UPI001DB0CEEB|nr:nickel pincer cofactor biosynthesis protein LarC [Veillonella sp.]MBS6391481.1 nickel pincer cofactor biosynthesis protein LarC [Veillonella sp.]